MGILDFFKKRNPEPVAPDLNLDMNAGLPGMPNLDPGLGPEFDQHPADLSGGTNPSSMNMQSATNLSSMGFQSGSQQTAAMMGVAGGTQPTYASYPQQPPADLQKDLQILSLKLDAIKSQLDSVNQRVSTIERIALKDEQQMQQKRWY